MAIKIQGTTIINDVTAYIDLAGSTAVKVPTGTTAQQPAGVAGMLRYNSESASFEGHNGTAWGAIGGGGADETARTLATLALTNSIKNFESLGKLVTTSGTAQTLSGLTLTDYEALFVVVNGVSHDSGTSRNILLGTGQITTGGPYNSSAILSGFALVMLNSGTSIGLVAAPTSTPSPRFESTGYTTASTSISFTLDGAGNFDAGTISVWGLRV